MPRGNLESIFPRALVLARARELLTELKFGAAFQLLRRQSVDLNLLYDHNPEAFSANMWVPPRSADVHAICAHKAPPLTPIPLFYSYQ